MKVAEIAKILADRINQEHYILKYLNKIYALGYKKGKEEANKKSNWISVNERLPEPLQTVWLSNGKGWVCLGCLVQDQEGYHWAQSNGIIYQENEAIVSECESDDLDVQFWHELPKAILINEEIKK